MTGDQDTAPEREASANSSKAVFPPPVFSHLCAHLSASTTSDPTSNDASDLHTLAALLRTSKQLYNIAAPYLYKRLTVTKENAPGIWAGLVLAELPNDGRGPLRFGRGKYKDKDKGKDGGGGYRWPEESADSDSGEEDPDMEWEGQTGDDEGRAEARSLLLNGGGRRMIYNRRHTSTLKATSMFTTGTWPDITSHNRKLSLLGHVQHLHILSPPSTRLSYRIVSSLLHPSTTPSHISSSQPTLFTSCTHLTLSSGTLWTLAEWSDRHRHRSHPFTRALLDMVKPRYLCMTHLDITPWLRDEWLSKRIDLDVPPESEEKLREMKDRWWGFAHWYPSRTAKNLCALWEQLEGVDVHHVVDAFPALPPGDYDGDVMEKAETGTGIGHETEGQAQKARVKVKVKVKVWFECCPCERKWCNGIVASESERRKRSAEAQEEETDDEGTASNESEDAPGVPAASFIAPDPSDPVQRKSKSGQATTSDAGTLETQAEDSQESEKVVEEGDPDNETEPGLEGSDNGEEDEGEWEEYTDTHTDTDTDEDDNEGPPPPPDECDMHVIPPARAQYIADMHMPRTPLSTKRSAPRQSPNINSAHASTQRVKEWIFIDAWRTASGEHTHVYERGAVEDDTGSEAREKMVRGLWEQVMASGMTSQGICEERDRETEGEGMGKVRWLRREHAEACFCCGSNK